MQRLARTIRCAGAATRSWSGRRVQPQRFTSV